MACAVGHHSVSPPRSSNRTCGFPASGSPTGFTARYTVDPHDRLVSRDDTVARHQPSPCGRAFSEASGCLVVLPGSSPITDPQPLRKRARSQGPFLRRHYPASQVVRPCPTPARPAVLATTLGCDLQPKRASPDYPDHLPNVPCPLPRWIGTGACVGCFPIPRGLPRQTGGSASTSSLSRPAQASLALRPAGSLDRPRRPLSRGFETASYPTAPLVSYQINRQLSGWHLPPLVFRAFGAHCLLLAETVEEL